MEDSFQHFYYSQKEKKNFNVNNSIDNTFEWETLRWVFFSVKIRKYNECNDILIVMNIFEHFTQAITVGNYPKKIT